MHISSFSPPLSAACLLLAINVAHADEWVIDRAVSSRVTHNDNVTMQQDNPQPDTHLTLSPSLSLSNRTEMRDINAKLGASANRYANHPENNSVDYQATFNLSLVTELEQRSITLASVRDSTLNSELATTGVVLARRQRTLSSAQTFWQHALNDKTSANAAYSLTLARYDAGPGLEDYDDQSVAAGLNHKLSERASIGSSISLRDYRTVSGNVKSRVASISIDGQIQYSERLRFNAGIGGQRSQSDLRVEALVCPLGATILCNLFNIPFDMVVVPIKSDGQGTTFNAGTLYQLESGKLTAQAGRGLNASGGGSLLSSDQFGINYQHNFSETLSTSIGASTTRSRNLDSSVENNRYSSLSAALQWQLDQWLSVSVGMTQSTQIAAGQSQSANSNLSFFNLNYNFQPRSLD